MLFSEIKGYLSYGELSLLNIGASLTDNTHTARLVSSINLGLTELYKRFPVKLSEVTVQLAEEISQYVLHSSKSILNKPLNANPHYYYIIDSIYSPFKDDIIKIEAIYNEEGYEIPLNDESMRYSLFTTGHNIIQHPYPDNENAIFVQYRAGPVKLTDDITDDTDVDIPVQFAEALINYVAYRMFAAINMNSAEAVNYYAKFEAACALIDRLGIWHKTSNTNLKLENMGWL